MFWIVCALSIALLLALMLSLALQPKIIKRITGAILLFVGLSGIVLYGYGYTKLFGDAAQAAIRTLFSVFCMFLGRNEISTISTVPLLATPVMQLCLYTVHLLALYCTASAVMSTLGSKMIRSFRLLLLRHRNLHLIYGISTGTLEFAKRLRKEGRGLIAFVDPGTGHALEAEILQIGALTVECNDSGEVSAAFLRKIGMRSGTHKMTLYCLDDNEASNLRYAEAMRKALCKASVAPEQTSLTILLAEANRGSSLQASGSRYGYGSVAAYERAELLTRLMIHEWPPYETVQFKEDGNAAEDFEALIIGFGAKGQAALRSLIMNGQFANSRFRAAVFSEDCRRRAGSFFAKYAALEQNYDIRFFEMNVRSVEAFEHIMKHFSHLNYVAVCTGNDKENVEIARELSSFLCAHGMHPTVVMLGAKEASRIARDDGLIKTVSLFSPEVLCTDRLDATAMLLNHKYHEKEGRSIREDWADCDYFSRMSCRAAADYVDAFLCAAKTNRGEIRKNGFTPTDSVIDTLSRMEHLRWCAFHYAMGYRTMPAERFRERAVLYQLQKQDTGKATIRIGKDTEEKYHACLIPWEELPALAERECAVTGKAVDYQQMDRDNVLMIIDTLKTFVQAEDTSL